MEINVLEGKVVTNNLAFIYRPKEKNPFTGNFDYEYLVPSVISQQGKYWNYIVVTCYPSGNGVYAWKASDKKKYNTWMNGKMPCYYIPRSDCIYKPFDEVPEEMMELIRPSIIKQQTKWLKNQVENRDYTYRKKPSWMLEE